MRFGLWVQYFYESPEKTGHNFSLHSIYGVSGNAITLYMVLWGFFQSFLQRSLLCFTLLKRMKKDFQRTFKGNFGELGSRKILVFLDLVRFYATIRRIDAVFSGRKDCTRGGLKGDVKKRSNNLLCGQK